MILAFACFSGAYIAKRYFLAAFLPIYTILYLASVHILQRVTENVPDAPTFIDVLLGTTYGGLIYLSAIVVFAILGERFGSRISRSTDT